MNLGQSEITILPIVIGLILYLYYKYFIVKVARLYKFLLICNGIIMGIIGFAVALLILNMFYPQDGDKLYAWIITLLLTFGAATQSFIFAYILEKAIDIEYLDTSKCIDGTTQFKTAVNDVKEKIKNSNNHNDTGENASQIQAVNKILDKISTNGYQNLLESEKLYLLQIAKNGFDFIQYPTKPKQNMLSELDITIQEIYINDKLELDNKSYLKFAISNSTHKITFSLLNRLEKYHYNILTKGHYILINILSNAKETLDIGETNINGITYNIAITGENILKILRENNKDWGSLYLKEIPPDYKLFYFNDYTIVFYLMEDR